MEEFSLHILYYIKINTKRVAGDAPTQAHVFVLCGIPMLSFTQPSKGFGQITPLSPLLHPLFCFLHGFHSKKSTSSCKWLFSLALSLNMAFVLLHWSIHITTHTRTVVKADYLWTAQSVESHLFSYIFCVLQCQPPTGRVRYNHTSSEMYVDKLLNREREQCKPLEIGHEYSTIFKVNTYHWLLCPCCCKNYC